MPTLLPFRQYDEHDVINLFGWSGAIPVNKGTLVKAVASGWRTDEAGTIQFLGSPGATFGNTVSERYGVKPRVTFAGTGDSPIGMLLYDVREQDENGQLLKFVPRKADEMQCAVSGQAVPIATRGLFLVSGEFNGGARAGDPLFPSGNGLWTTSTTGQNNGANEHCNSKVGKLIGAPNSKGHALVYLNIA
jgi:hypothetical protein